MRAHKRLWAVLGLLFIGVPVALGQAVAPSGGGGVLTADPVGSTPNSAGASISGGVLTLQPASATEPGVVTTGAQTFAGSKSFNGDTVLNGTRLLSCDGSSSVCELTLTSRRDDGATAVGVVSNTDAFTTAGAKIHAFRNNGVEKAYVDKDGKYFVGTTANFGASNLTLQNNSSMSYGSSGGPTTLMGSGTSAVVGAWIIDNNTTISDPAGRILIIRNGGVDKAHVDKDGQVSGRAGTGAGTVTYSGSLDIQSTTGNNVGSGEDDLHTYTMPANSLSTTNRGIKWEGFGGVANNANSKTLKVYFGAQLISVAIPINTAARWVGEAKIIRTGASAQRYMIRVDVIDTTTNTLAGAFVSSGTLTQTETGTIVIKATGEAVADSDITQAISVVSYF